MKRYALKRRTFAARLKRSSALLRALASMNAVLGSQRRSEAENVLREILRRRTWE